PISPHLIQVCGNRSISCRASPRMATMCRGSPRADAASANTPGSGPRPAIIPSGPVILLASGSVRLPLSSGRRCGIVRYAELAVRLRFDELDDLLGKRVCREHAFHVLQPLLQRSFGRKKHAIGLAKLM